MSSIGTYYTNAELAMAAYADLSAGRPAESRLVDIGMSDSQAEQFADNWTVIDQYDGAVEKSFIDELGEEHFYINHTGLSVTLFQNSETGEQVVACSNGHSRMCAA